MSILDILPPNVQTQLLEIDWLQLHKLKTITSTSIQECFYSADHVRNVKFLTNVSQKDFDVTCETLMNNPPLSFLLPSQIYEDIRRYAKHCGSVLQHVMFWIDPKSAAYAKNMENKPSIHSDLVSLLFDSTNYANDLFALEVQNLVVQFVIAHYSEFTNKKEIKFLSTLHMDKDSDYLTRFEVNIWVELLALVRRDLQEIPFRNPLIADYVTLTQEVN